MLNVPSCLLPSPLPAWLQGLEALLGGGRGGAFDLSGNIWDRKVGEALLPADCL